jgi:hypothetical protein
VDALEDDQTLADGPPFSAEDQARLLTFLGEAERRGVPPDRFHPGEPIESVLVPSAAEAAAHPPAAAKAPAAALEQVLALLASLDSEGRQQVMARCQTLDAAHAAGDPRATT